MEKEMDTPSEKKMVKPLVWAAIGGGILIFILLLATGWQTSGSAEEEAKALAHQEVVSVLTDICVAQFQEDPNKEELFKELEATSSWTRGDYVKEKGWATMPGKEKPNNDIASECAKKIMESRQ